MTLEDYRATYYELSGKASEIARNISFAGIALIWVFRDEKAGPLAVPDQLLLPALLIVVALFLDLLQYIVGTAVWGAFARHHEKLGKQPDTALLAPAFLNWPALVCFWTKLAVVLVAYFCIFQFVAESLGLR